VTREADGQGRQLPWPSEDTSLGRESFAIVPPGDDDDPVVAKLRRLHYRHGYFTRRELGEPAPRGCWDYCPGEFGPDGKFREHCGRVA
jgi:hypothetical protein